MALSDLQPNVYSKRILSVGSAIVFIAALTLYLICLDPGASLWDCPEYVLAAYRLEVGHPPGNPTWQLMANVASHLATSPEKAAFAINLTSALATALAAMLLYKIIYLLLRYSLFKGHNKRDALFCGLSGMSGALSFAWCDSTIFSAVEAEVYALSIFFTALMIWLMIKWGKAKIRGENLKALRILFLTAYISGLAIGVHELNLLAFTAMALIYVFVSYKQRVRLKAWLGTGVSFLLIGTILLLYIPGLVRIAGSLELICVNDFGGKYNSGVILFIILLFGILSILPYLAGYITKNRKISIFCQGILFFTIGLSSYFLIPLRASANPPINQGDPDDPFSFYSYFKREQYGEKPLFYGPSPYSKPLLKETVDSVGNYLYPSLYSDAGMSRYGKFSPNSVIVDRKGFLDSEDRETNDMLTGKKHGYIKYAKRPEYRYPPEQNMLFPRMTSRDPIDIKSYENWGGMTQDEMIEVKVSEAVDSSGKAVGRMNNITGEREKRESLRPSYLQQLRFMGAYQIGYMYLRYLLWNFSGRQNNIPSTGEIEHGNFITGISFIDNLILGDQTKLPYELREGNRGYNRYFLLPFIVGIIGAIGFSLKNQRCKRVDAVVLALFLMTGLAVVFYLNQTPGQPRERDYAFLGSFMAFSIWIAFGMAIVLEKIVKLKISNRKIALAIASILSAGLPLLILSQTYNDHYRGGRSSAESIAYNLLNSLEKDAILLADGDNYIFPLWYAQEVLGIRKDVTVICAAFLNTPSYPGQLQISGEKAPSLKLSAKPGQLAFGGFSMIKIGNSNDTIQAKEALTLLYDETESMSTSVDGGYMTEIPAFPTRYVKFKDKEEKEIVIDLKEMSGSRNTLNQKQLLILDMVVNNTESENPRPIYWHNLLPPSDYEGFTDYLLPTLFTHKFTGTNTTEKAHQADFEGYTATQKLQEGGDRLKGYYAEPYVAHIMAQQRFACIQLAERLLQKGKQNKAMEVLGKALTLWPFETIPSTVKDINGNTFDEAEKTIEILEGLPETHGGFDRLSRLREKTIEYLAKRKNQYKTFYMNLPASRRNAISSESNRLIDNQ